MSLKTFSVSFLFVFLLFFSSSCLFVMSLPFAFASKMEKFSNDFLTVGTPATMSTSRTTAKATDFLYVLLAKLERENYLFSVPAICWFFPLLLRSDNKFFKKKLKWSPIVCLRCVHFIRCFIHSHPSLLSLLSHDNFHCHFRQRFGHIYRLSSISFLIYI